MIDAKELRLNNLVTDEFYEHFKTTIKVESINDKGINLFVEDDGNYSELAQTWVEPEYTFNKLYPIPLTPELLEKCGFEGLPHFNIQNSMMKSIGRGRVISIGCVGTPNEMVFLTEEDAPKVNAVIVLRNFDYDGKTYLHTLQNLFYVLTGEELNVEL